MNGIPESPKSESAQNASRPILTRTEKPRKNKQVAPHRHKLRSVWSSMKYRCSNPNSKSFIYYGQRGISVCDEWGKSFMDFYRWANSNGWEAGLHIDRINNDGNYEPGNCRFVVAAVNMSNKGKYKVKQGKKYKKTYKEKGRNKYRAEFLLDGNRIRKNGFLTKEDAITWIEYQ